MKMLMKSFGVIVMVLALGIAACGPEPGESETEVEVTTEEEGGGSNRDTVVERTTVIQPAETVVTNNTTTVVERQVDTVVKTVPGRTDTVVSQPRRSTVSASERAQIDAWLAANDATLNQYGDPDGTVYAGGTPLFDEATGQTIDKYDYIVRQHPDRPWRGGVSRPRR